MMKFPVILLSLLASSNTVVGFGSLPLFGCSSSLQQPVHGRLHMAKNDVGIFFGTSTGSTEMAAELIAAQFDGDDTPDVVDIDTIQGSLASEFNKYKALIVGTPTWNTGADTERSGTGWDEVYYTEMQDNSALSAALLHKKVAVFGMGDSVSYAENYADATGELHDIFLEICKTEKLLGYTSQEGYEHEDSKAILENGQFCGLLLDNVNFEELTPPRIETWVTQLKEEGILESTSNDVDDVAAPPVAEPAVPMPPTADVDDMHAIVAQLERENAALKEQLLSSTASPVMAGSDGYEPHYNAKTGRTMWTSPDGRTCYYTQVTSTNMSP